MRKKSKPFCVSPNLVMKRIAYGPGLSPFHEVAISLFFNVKVELRTPCGADLVVYIPPLEPVHTGKKLV
jgi:hypothetical protein